MARFTKKASKGSTKQSGGPFRVMYRTRFVTGEDENGLKVVPPIGKPGLFYISTATLEEAQQCVDELNAVEDKRRVYLQETKPHFASWYREFSVYQAVPNGLLVDEYLVYGPSMNRDRKAAIENSKQRRRPRLVHADAAQ